MKNDTYGHWWGRTAEARPAVVETCHVTKRPHRWYRRWKFPDWVINYTLAPSSESYRLVSASRPWQERLPHTLHLHPPGALHWQRVRKGSLSRTVYVKFLGGEAAGLNALVDPKTRCGRFLDPDNIAGALLEEIAHIGQDQGDRGFERAQSVLWALIARLKESVPAEGGARRTGDRAPAPAPSDLVEKVDAYLAAHVAQQVKLSELARYLNLSVSLVSHRYREETGLPPKKRLTQMRMDLVKKMLLSGQSLKAAAVAAGIPDPYYLSRAFKREEGISPRTYRKQLQGTHGPEV